jgi:hypothetical protein
MKPGKTENELIKSVQTEISSAAKHAPLRIRFSSEKDSGSPAIERFCLNILINNNKSQIEISN